MNFKNLLRQKGFYVALAGLLIFVLQLFGVKIPAPYVNEIISGVCSIMVVTGLLSTKEKDEIDETLDETFGNNDSGIEPDAEIFDPETDIAESTQDTEVGDNADAPDDTEHNETDA